MSTKKPTEKRNPFVRVSEQSHGQIQGDQERQIAAERGRSVAVIPILSVQGRLNLDYRPLGIDHVVDIAGSIMSYGLITPIALDNKRRLVAGAHRRAAVLGLASLIQPEKYRASWLALWEGSPEKLNDKDIDAKMESLRTEKDLLLTWWRTCEGLIESRNLPFDSEDDAERARISEILENEKRKPFKRDQILAAAKDLMERTDYRTEGGRPRVGQPALKRTLALVFGTSYSTVRRALEPKESPATPDHGKARRSLETALSRFLATAPSTDALTKSAKKLLHDLTAHGEDSSPES